MQTSLIQDSNSVHRVHNIDMFGIISICLIEVMKDYVSQSTLHTVTWYPTETIETRLILSSRWNEQWQPVKKVTVKKECRSQRGYQQRLVLSNLRSPDTGRGKDREAKWLAETLKRKCHLLPVSEKNEKKNELFGRVRSGQTNHSQYSGLKTKEYLRHEGPQVLQASVKKNRIKSISTWKKKDSPVEPRRKIR